MIPKRPSSKPTSKLKSPQTSTNLKKSSGKDQQKSNFSKTNSDFVSDNELLTISKEKPENVKKSDGILIPDLDLIKEKQLIEVCDNILFKAIEAFDMAKSMKVDIDTFIILKKFFPSFTFDFIILLIRDNMNDFHSCWNILEIISSNDINSNRFSYLQSLLPHISVDTISRVVSDPKYESLKDMEEYLKSLNVESKIEKETSVVTNVDYDSPSQIINDQAENMNDEAYEEFLRFFPNTNKDYVALLFRECNYDANLAIERHFQFIEKNSNNFNDEACIFLKQFPTADVIYVHILLTINGYNVNKAIEQHIKSHETENNISSFNTVDTWNDGFISSQLYEPSSNENMISNSIKRFLAAFPDTDISYIQDLLENCDNNPEKAIEVHSDAVLSSKLSLEFLLLKRCFPTERDDNIANLLYYNDNNVILCFIYLEQGFDPGARAVFFQSKFPSVEDSAIFEMVNNSKNMSIEYALGVIRQTFYFSSFSNQKTNEINDPTKVQESSSGQGSCDNQPKKPTQSSNEKTNNINSNPSVKDNTYSQTKIISQNTKEKTNIIENTNKVESKPTNEDIFVAQPKKVRKPGEPRLLPKTQRDNRVYDLHGYTAYEASVFVDQILEEALDEGCKTVQFITGKGIHSVGRSPVLRPLVLQKCRNKHFKAFVRKDNEGIVEVCLR